MILGHRVIQCDPGLQFGRPAGLQPRRNESAPHTHLLFYVPPHGFPRSQCYDRPACLYTKISVTSTTVNVLLADPGSSHLTR
jgi:hypothetical protein